MTKYNQDEERIRALLKKGEIISFNGEKYQIVESGKPKRSSGRGGEPKTDVYVLAENDLNESIEIKITYKKENADFLENKVSAERAYQIFGDSWVDTIKKCTESKKDEFLSRKRIYKVNDWPTRAGSITLGWRFELFNKKQGTLSGEIEMTTEQIEEVYSGKNLSESLRDAKVNNKIISNSGVAEYIVVSDSLETAQDVIDNMELIKKYVEKNPKIYFGCKALNYRTYVAKYDGDRPLAVQLNWIVRNNMLVSEVVFDKPFQENGMQIKNKLISSMRQLGVKTTDDINEFNSNLEFVHY